MDEQKLNEWAAQLMGDQGDEATFAVDTQIYTQSIGAALVVLATMAEDGCEVELTMSKGGVNVEVDEAEVAGDWADAAKLIVQACYNCATSKGEDDGDDA